MEKMEDKTQRPEVFILSLSSVFCLLTSVSCLLTSAIYNLRKICVLISIHRVDRNQHLHPLDAIEIANHFGKVLPALAIGGFQERQYAQQGKQMALSVIKGTLLLRSDDLNLKLAVHKIHYIRGSKHNGAFDILKKCC